jgi:hypothetical protein
MLRYAAVWRSLLVCLLGIVPALRASAGGREPLVFGGWQLAETAKASQAEQERTFLYGARTLEAGSMGIAAGLGFPYLVVDGAVGTSDRTDLRLSIRALYGLMSQIGLEGRLRLKAFSGPQPLALALRLGGSWSFYPEQRVAMAISGTRDLGAQTGLVVSVGGIPGAVVFVELGVEAAVDLHPESQALGGLPPPYTLLFNLPLHLGIELRVSRSFRLTSVLGIDGHVASRYRRGEAPILPYVAVLLDVLH